MTHQRWAIEAMHPGMRMTGREFALVERAGNVCPQGLDTD
jgi:hypothetical protein